MVAKVATSIDGRVAAADGSSRWLTSELARADAHELRADSQAVMVGSGTALTDRPALTVRDVAWQPDHPPTRVLVDARGRVPAIGPLFDTVLAPTLVVTTATAEPGAIDAWCAAGAKVEVVAAAAGGTGVDLGETFVGARARRRAAGAGGRRGHVAGQRARRRSRAAARRVHRATRARYPRRARRFDFAGPDTIRDARRFRLASVRELGPDVRLDYEVGS